MPADPDLRQAPAVIRTGATGLTVPELVADAGDEATIRFVEFFTAHIRNPNTRAAYGRAAATSSPGANGPASAPCPRSSRCTSPPGSRASRAAIPPLPSSSIWRPSACCSTGWSPARSYAINPAAAAVRGPKHVVRKGKTPVLSPEETRALLDRIPGDTLAGRARPGADRPHGLQLRPHRRGARHAHRGCLPPAPAAVGAPARERRQAP